MKFEIIYFSVLCLIYKNGTTADSLISDNEIEEGQHIYYFNKNLVGRTKIKFYLTIFLNSIHKAHSGISSESL